MQTFAASTFEETEERMSDGIWVLGVPRSGTSMLAEVIHRWGAYAGTNLLPTAEHRNPRGFWEDMTLKEINGDLLASVDANTELPPPESADPVLAARAMASPWREHAQQLLSTFQQAAPVWVWKDPKMSLLLPFWQTLTKRWIAVIALRHPLATAMSYKRVVEHRYHAPEFTVPLDLMLVHWQRYILAILQHTQQNPNKIFVSYEQLIAAPEQECRRLCYFLNAVTGSPDADQDQKIQTMLEAVVPELQHHTALIPFDEVAEATPAQKALYHLLQDKIEQPHAPVDFAAIALPAGWYDVFLEQSHRVYASLRLAT